jgi:predicted acetyltransferase
VQVTIESAADRAETVENLFQLYVHDFSDFWTQRQVDLGEDGRFPPFPPLASYWTEPHREPLLIRADGNVAGFALLNRHSHSGLPVDVGMGEFFVARPYRREGVGRAAALEVIGARPGQWEIAVARRNLPALSFWRGVAAAAAPEGVDERDQDDARWNGTILRFVRTRAATP